MASRDTAESSAADLDQGGLSRRNLLVSGASAVAGVAGGSLLEPLAASAQEPGGDPHGPSVNGLLKEVRQPDSLVFESYHLDLGTPPTGASLPEGPQLAVKVASDTRLWRGQPASIGDFKPGDKLIAYVRWEGTELVAWGVEPLCEAVEAVVSSRTGNQLKTSKGAVVVNGYTLMVPTNEGSSAQSLGAIAKGHRIFATCWFDRNSGEYIARNIGIRAK